MIDVMFIRRQRGIRNLFNPGGALKGKASLCSHGKMRMMFVAAERVW